MKKRQFSCEKAIFIIIFIDFEFHILSRWFVADNISFDNNFSSIVGFYYWYSQGIVYEKIHQTSAFRLKKNKNSSRLETRSVCAHNPHIFLLLSQWITVFPVVNGMGGAAQKLYVSNVGRAKGATTKREKMKRIHRKISWK